jgi:4'-phosphopantetheinyl transferase EntD
MAHDDRIAVAALGLRRDLDAVSIDIEPAAPLSPEILELIVTPRERRAIADNPLGDKASLRHQGGGLQGDLPARS